MTARHWTSRHRDDLLTRVTVLTAGTAVLGAIGATGLAVGMAEAAPPKTTAAAVVADPTPTDAAPAATVTVAPRPSPTASAVTAARTTSARTTQAKATSKATPKTVVKAAPVVTKKAYVPPPAPPAPKPKPTATSGGS